MIPSFSPAPKVARRDTILLALEASRARFDRKRHQNNTKAVLQQNIDIRKALGEVYETGEINQEILAKGLERQMAFRDKHAPKYAKRKEVSA